MMLGSLAAGALLALTQSPAVAAERSPATPDRTAYYNGTLSTAVPNTLTTSVPPGALCVVAPQVCPDAITNGTAPIAEGIGDAQTSEPAKPADPVPQGGLPASTYYGKPYHVSALAFPVAAPPSGQEYATFEVALKETRPTFALSSPALRQAVLAAFASVGARAPVTEEFAKIVSEPCPAGTTEGTPVPCFLEDALPDLEACPIVSSDGDWEAGASQGESAVPDVDCNLGATAARADDGTWVFDLRLAANAWTSGQLPNNGVLIRTAGAPNFAFGDKDSTTFKQVTLDSASLATGGEFQPAGGGAFGLDFGSDFGGGSFGSGETGGFNDGGFASGGGSFDSGGFTTDSGGSFDSGGFGTDTGVADPVAAPEAAPAPEVAPDGSVAEGDPTAIAPEFAGAMDPGSAWYVWLLVPVFLAGAYLTAQSLMVPAEVSAAAAGREGAMTRLIRRQELMRAADAPELIRF